MLSLGLLRLGLLLPSPLVVGQANPPLPGFVAQKPWHAQLTGLITQETKLVGATISCAGIKLNIEHPTLHVPHVQVCDFRSWVEGYSAAGGGGGGLG